MAGSDPRFNPAEFREAIHFAMNMGLPSMTSQRATFRWLPEKEYEKQDSGGNPFSWDSSPTYDNQKNDVQVPVAVEYFPDSPNATTVGEFNNPRVVITVLDEDWDTVMENTNATPTLALPDLVILDDGIYEVSHLRPPIGLFEVTVYQVEARSVRDEG